MRLRAWRSLALNSAVFAALLGAGVRPRYGGTLRVQFAGPVPALDPSDPAVAPLVHLVFETLVRLDERSEPRLHLASGWQHDPSFKRWRITVRQNPTFHDGTPLSASAAVPSIAAALPNASVGVAQQTLTIQSETPMPALLHELAQPRTAIVRRASDGLLTGTGPFQWRQPGEAGVITLVANESYWNGRPFLDSAVISAAAGQPDVIEIPVGGPRRVVPERLRVWTSPPLELLAIQVLNATPAVREALSLSIDRAAIAKVLTAGRGEPAQALLPQWLSGHAFLFKGAPDLPRARQLVAGERTVPLAMSYPASDPLARAVADRIAVNARDAGLSIQVSPQSVNPPLRLVRHRITSIDPEQALAGISSALGLPRIPGGPVTSLYESERAPLENWLTIPLLHLPDVFAIHPRVRYWDEAHGRKDGLLHLEDVWIEP